MNKWMAFLTLIAGLSAGACATDTELEREPPSAETRARIQFLNSNNDFVAMIADLEARGWTLDWHGARERLREPAGGSDERVVEVPVRRLNQRNSPTMGWAGVVDSGAGTTPFLNLPSGAGGSDGPGSPTAAVGGVSTARQAVVTIGSATCAPYYCNYPSAITWAWWCINPDTNPFGYALRRIVRRGYSTCNNTRYGVISNPSWYANRCGGTVACPGVEQSVSTYVACVVADGSQDFCQ